MKLLKQFGELDFFSQILVLFALFILCSGACDIVKIITNGVVNGIYR